MKTLSDRIMRLDGRYEIKGEALTIASVKQFIKKVIDSNVNGMVLVSTIKFEAGDKLVEAKEGK